MKHLKQELKEKGFFVSTFNEVRQISPELSKAVDDFLQNTCYEPSDEFLTYDDLEEILNSVDTEDWHYYDFGEDDPESNYIQLKLYYKKANKEIKEEIRRVRKDNQALRDEYLSSRDISIDDLASFTEDFSERLMRTNRLLIKLVREVI